MGLLGALTGWDQHNDATNALLASHLVVSMTPDLKRRIINTIIEIRQRVEGARAGTADQIIQDLNSRPRIVQMNFVALACNNLGIGSNVKGYYFSKVQNPYRTNSDDCRARIEAMIPAVRRKDPSVSWPGDDKRVNFREWL